VSGAATEGITVVIAGGGYGGHVYPAVAVAEAMLEDPEIAAVYYVGCPDEMEERLVRGRCAIPFLDVRVSEMPRELSPRLVPWAAQLPGALWGSVGHLRRVAPDVVLGTGAFVSGPVLLAALLLRIPFVAHDADVEPGLVSRLMAPFARKMTIAYEEARAKLFARSFELTGNPMRAVFTRRRLEKAEARRQLGLQQDRATVLAIGGSRGSLPINDAVAAAALPMIDQLGVQLIHQTGERGWQRHRELLERSYPALLEHDAYVNLPYLDDVSLSLSAADLVVSRAGSLSISEFNMHGLPAILVPQSNADQDHQRFNARALAARGAAVYQEESELDGPTLLRLVGGLLGDEERLEAMSRATRALFRPDATARIVEIVKAVARRR